MAKHYPQEFREDVVAVARGREPGVTLPQIAKDFGISDQTVTNWLKQADIEEGRKPAQSKDEWASRMRLRRSAHRATSGSL
ncbi:MAG TPA: helix-turn-helix domain-containing protein [Galbitalea sp.]|jgi:transposase-like protein|nr:helix-turn-helix domain-containing protein [Galbitalea sp.]